MVEPAQLEVLQIEDVGVIDLVLVGDQPNTDIETALGVNYLMVDWGLAHALEHRRLFPDVPAPRIRVSQAKMALAHLLALGGFATVICEAFDNHLADTIVVQRLYSQVKFGFNDHVAGFRHTRQVLHEQPRQCVGVEFSRYFQADGTFQSGHTRRPAWYKSRVPGRDTASLADCFSAVVTAAFFAVFVVLPAGRAALLLATVFFPAAPALVLRIESTNCWRVLSVVLMLSLSPRSTD